MASKLNSIEAESVISALRSGTVPSRFVSSYSSPGDFATKVATRHFQKDYEQGKIRFVSGNWGSGKTHFLMRLQEEAFESNFLVSSFEIKAEETPFNKFEKVFFGIVRNITSDQMYKTNKLNESIPFARVLQDFLETQPDWESDPEKVVRELDSKLMSVASIDIDFKRVIIQFWQTFLNEGSSAQDFETRARLLQWFEGVGTPALFRKDFRIQKVVNKENARLMLQSLANFIRWMGFSGLVILFDEAEMTHTTMRKSILRQAHNNLLHLINEIHDTPGAILVYATVPSFFTDPNHGIQTYGALAQRIGELPSIAPSPLQRVWNIDRIDVSNEEQLEVCLRILSLYQDAYSEEINQLPNSEVLKKQISELLALRPKFTTLSSWRLAITGTVQILDYALEGIAIPKPEAQYDGILKLMQDDDS
jgi:hypothetical protein